MVSIKSISENGTNAVVLFTDGQRVICVPTPTGVWIPSREVKFADDGGTNPPDPGNPSSSGTRFAWPFNPANQVTSEFGPRNGRLHAGIDFGMGGVTSGSPIKCAGDGKVWKTATTGNHGGYGNTVIVDHGGGLLTLYAHMIDGSFRVREGQSVKQNAILGLVGNTGNSFGAHLHFETHEGGYRWYDSARNPRLFYTKYNGK